MSGQVIAWSKGAERCASREEAEWLSICPGGRVSRNVTGVYCTDNVEKE